MPHITSYDYDCPISEAGSTGQPGIGGDNKFEVRDLDPIDPKQRLKLECQVELCCNNCLWGAAPLCSQEGCAHMTSCSSGSNLFPQVFTSCGGRCRAHGRRIAACSAKDPTSWVRRSQCLHCSADDSGGHCGAHGGGAVSAAASAAHRGLRRCHLDGVGAAAGQP